MKYVQCFYRLNKIEQKTVGILKRVYDENWWIFQWTSRQSRTSLLIKLSVNRLPVGDTFEYGHPKFKRASTRLAIVAILQLGYYDGELNRRVLVSIF